MKKRMAKIRNPKPVTYVLIPPTSDVGLPMYERLSAILNEHHQDLWRSNVRIALAWSTNWKADVDGRLTLGKCRKASDLDRELAPFDFVILLNRDFWLNPRISDLQRTALLDHELMHAAIAHDEDGEPKVDAHGRTVYRIRKHDLEEFEGIAARYGCWKKDIEAFAAALSRAELGARAWVGYSRLHEALVAIGLDVPVTTIATWDDDARREVLTWALLHQDSESRTVNVRLSPTMPNCLAVVVHAPSAAATH